MNRKNVECIVEDYKGIKTLFIYNRRKMQMELRVIHVDHFYTYSSNLLVSSETRQRD